MDVKLNSGILISFLYLVIERKKRSTNIIFFNKVLESYKKRYHYRYICHITCANVSILFYLLKRFPAVVSFIALYTVNFRRVYVLTMFNHRFSFRKII